MARGPEYTVENEFYFVKTGITKKENELTPEEKKRISRQLCIQGMKSLAQYYGLNIKIT